ncbi:MAG: hypothetical protein IKK21_00515 [Clostridia bacterium]|nr:hypothetical protein [Clostridia bacterium]
MKHAYRRIMAQLLALILLLGAISASAEGLMPENRILVDVAAVGQETYLLVNRSGRLEIWRWREGEDAAVKLPGDFLRASDLWLNEEIEEGDEEKKYAMTALFSDGTRLLALNPANGLVFEVHPSEDGVTYTDVVTLGENELLYRGRDAKEVWYAGHTALAASGRNLFWYGTSWDEASGNNVQRVICFSLEDGSARILPIEGISTLCAGPAGTVIFAARPLAGTDGVMKPYTVSCYDPADDSASVLGQIDTTRAVTRLTWSAALGMVIWQEGTNMMGMIPGEAAQLCAYVPTTASGDLAVMGDTLIYAGTKLVVARTLQPGLTVPQSLQVMHGGFDEAATAFAFAHPDVPVEIINDQEGDAGFEPWLRPADGSEAVDVLRLYTTTDDRDFAVLRDAGMLMDLSVDEEIAAYVADLYPPFRELVTGENGEIWAVPTETVSYTGFFINRKAMTDMGFSPEDMPANLVELCEFITMWDEKYADRYPNYTCIDSVEDARRFLADYALNMWVVHCQATGREVRFDAPEFRKVMEAVASVSAKRTEIGMQVVNPEISDYKAGLFWFDCQLVGNWASYMEEYSDRIFVPLTMTADMPFHAVVEGVELWVINGETTAAEYALAFVREQMHAVSDKYAHVLLTSRTEAVESEYYAGYLSEAQRRLGDLQMQLLGVTNGDAEAAIRLQICQQEAYMATELPRMQYTVTPSAVENYVNVLAPAMTIRRHSLLQDTSEGVNAWEYTRDRWLQGKITTDQLIHELNARMLMLEMSQE